MAGLLVLGLVPTSESLSLVPATVSGELLVGFKGSPDTGLLRALGATPVRTLGAISVVQVTTTDVFGLSRALAIHPNVAFVESNDPLSLAQEEIVNVFLTSSNSSASSWDMTSQDASSWDASSWDASSWDASSWDASSWDASSWDASSWDASSWDASSWDASSWDASSWDASSWDASSWDASSWDWSERRDQGFHVQWGLGAARFDDAWNVSRGQGRSAICVLDTGVDITHPDLRPAVVARYDARLGGTNPHDTVGHGTHVAGIIGAVAGNVTGIAGAVNEPIISVKVMGTNGGKDADLAAGLERCVLSKARVATMSLHLDRHSPSVERAVASAHAAGLLLVAATGNDGWNTTRYPAAYPGVIAVGAIAPNATRASFSNHGPRLDIVAPGVKIASTIPGGYAMGSGTSQAAPFVAAAAALVWDVKANQTAATVRSTLLSSARDLGPAGWDRDTGAGALDVAAALGR